MGAKVSRWKREHTVWFWVLTVLLPIGAAVLLFMFIFSVGVFAVAVTHKQLIGAKLKYITLKRKFTKDIKLLIIEKDINDISNRINSYLSNINLLLFSYDPSKDKGFDIDVDKEILYVKYKSNIMGQPYAGTTKGAHLDKVIAVAKELMKKNFVTKIRIKQKSPKKKKTRPGPVLRPRGGGRRKLKRRRNRRMKK